MKYDIEYVAPPFEEVQHEKVVVDKDGVCRQMSYHDDVALMQRIAQLHLSANQLEVLKNQLQPIIDNSNLRDQFEASFGKLTDNELIDSCPSRYIQTQSEQMAAFKDLAKAHQQEALERIKAAKEKEDKEKIAKEDEELRSKLNQLWSSH